MQFAISNFVGVQLTDIAASLTAMGALVLLLSYWGPRDGYLTRQEHAGHFVASATRRPGRELFLAWSPYLLLVFFVVVWGIKPVLVHLNRPTLLIDWPWLHNQIQRMPPVSPRPAAYGAVFTFNWLSAAGTSCVLAAIGSAFLLGMSVREFAALCIRTGRQLLAAEFTMALVLAIAFLMNYCGATGTLGLAFAATGRLFPVLQRYPGVGGSIPDRQRYVRQRPVWKPPGGHRDASGDEPGPDGSRQFQPVV